MNKNSHPRYFIQTNEGDIPYHGGAGYHDADLIMHRLGVLPIRFPHNERPSLLLKIRQGLFLLRAAVSLPSRAIIFFQFPLYHTLARRLLHLIVRFKGANAVCFVMDIDGLRDDDVRRLHYDELQLRRFTYFLVHNHRMQKWLTTVVPWANIARINFFDLLTELGVGKKEKSFRVAWTGNLDKGTFVYALGNIQHSPRLHFEIYGSSRTPPALASDNVSFHGSVHPYQLPALLTASFGLVWDGPGIDRCEGAAGNYLRLISPHKLSTYILAGLPIIAPQNTATADLVIEYQIGFCVESLHEIESRIEEIDTRRYHEMAVNTIPVARRISGGMNLESAIEKLLKKMPN